MPGQKKGSVSLQQLNAFLGVAARSTYAAGIEFKVDKETGFKEMDFRQGDWTYRDSYCGFFRSWGREVVWHSGKPVWTHQYGGGMETQLIEDSVLAGKTFDFLKTALSNGDKEGKFQPRGPRSFKKGDWEYFCSWEGDISKFKGNEEIRFRGRVLFTHDFFGGLVVPKSA